MFHKKNQHERLKRVIEAGFCLSLSRVSDQEKFPFIALVSWRTDVMSETQTIDRRCSTFDEAFEKALSFAEDVIKQCQ